MPNGRKAAPLTRGNFRPCDDNVIPSFAKVAGAIKDNGAIAVQQLYHAGAPTAIPTIPFIPLGHPLACQAITIAMARIQ
jgi:2,4-dienoyl-CoA reductase-like NADH-dependent reductase (Old Yellow Enzyme family)